MRTSVSMSLRGIFPPLPNAKLREYSILLASNSPRRRELLGMIVPQFDIIEGRDINESYPQTLAPEQVPVFLSQLKAEAYRRDICSKELLITADTVVINKGRILGKPHDHAAAVSMLRALAGHSHIVVTGVSLTTTEKMESFAELTTVRFAQVDDSLISEYVDSYKPYDKAGAYGIQEWIGAVAIEGIQGCYYNVMGLPLHSLYIHLRNFLK